MHKQGRYSCNSRRSFMTTPSLPKHRTACLISAVLLATTAFSAGAYTTGKAGTTPQAQYQADVAHCKSGQSNQDQATCMQEAGAALEAAKRSEEHTSELQSLMRISYAVFCLNKKNKT